MIQDDSTQWLNPLEVNEVIAQTERVEDRTRIEEILAKAKEAKGLDLVESAALMALKDPELIEELFKVARGIKDKIYGRRIVLFAPLYISNLCKNECLYCGFKGTNEGLSRRILDQKEIAEETKIILDQGHKRILMVSGEHYPHDKGGWKYVLDSLETIYGVTGSKRDSKIRRINANLAPLSEERFKDLVKAEVGTYQLFQETYDRERYKMFHTHGSKSNFEWRATAIDRAMRAGIDDVGMGTLLGLSDWRFDTLSLFQHVKHLEKTYGMGCHTISVPRIEYAHGTDDVAKLLMPVSDDDFKKLVAILRVSVPYTGIIMSTREDTEMRQETYGLGVSQISAGSRTNPGGYAQGDQFDESQFQLGDHRALDEVVGELAEMGYIPSFCTACEERGRMGEDFMKIAREANIGKMCGPNAMLTFKEYLLQYGSEETKKAGEAVLQKEMQTLPEHKRERVNSNFTALEEEEKTVQELYI